MEWGTEMNLDTLQGRNIAVVGATGGVGREVVRMGLAAGARVLAVARGQARLAQLEGDFPGVQTLALDAAREDAPARVFEALRPDVLVIAAGALPPAAPLHQLGWREFAGNWEADAQMTFHFCKAALLAPLHAGSAVIVISSGAALAGSPISGGYAGAKRAQIFMVNYSQKEADRIGLSLRFSALAPRMMPQSSFGAYAVAGYAKYLGISEADFVRSMADAPLPAGVAAAALDVAARPADFRENVFIVSGKGLEAVPA